MLISQPHCGILQASFGDLTAKISDTWRGLCGEIADSETNIALGVWAIGFDDFHPVF